MMKIYLLYSIKKQKHKQYIDFASYDENIVALCISLQFALAPILVNSILYSMLKIVNEDVAHPLEQGQEVQQIQGEGLSSLPPNALTKVSKRKPSRKPSKV